MTPKTMGHGTLLVCDAIAGLESLPDGTPSEGPRTCVTSPPYWGLRDYGVDGQYGAEATPQEYADRLVEVFEQVRRVLRDDGTLWLNLGDTYARDGGARSCANYSKSSITNRAWANGSATGGFVAPASIGLKRKDLVGIPWIVAFALREAGWYLRSELIWHKTNAMPESAADRPSRAHEHVFLLSKRSTYFYDERAIAQPHADPRASKQGRTGMQKRNETVPRPRGNLEGQRWYRPDGRSARTVWSLPVSRYHGSHFATFPEKLAAKAILAGSELGDTVLDPFMGSGTVAKVAQDLGRRWVGIDIDPRNEALIAERTKQHGLFGAEESA